jgi:hypothetical protein
MKKPRRKGPIPEKKIGPRILRGQNNELVLAGALCHCFGVSPMAISRWRQELGLPHWQVRSDQNPRGYSFVYDLDDVAKWAKEHNRTFDRSQAFVGMRPPLRGHHKVGSGPWRAHSKLARPIPRIPRDDRISP